MALLDRYRTHPPQKHPDPSVRLAYVGELPIDERATLAAFAREDEDPRVRRAAVGKLMDPEALGAVVRDDTDQGVRDDATAMLRDIALEAFEGLGEPESFAAVDALQDVKTLAQIAREAQRDAVASRALARVSDVRVLGSVARHAALERIRLAALDALQDHDEIVAVAMNSEFKDSALAALERLSDRADLEQLAVRAKNKSAAKRARGILRDRDEAVVRTTAAEAEAVAAPDPVEVAAASRLHVIRTLEGLASDVTASAVEQALEEARTTWASIEGAPGPEMADRFAAAEAAGQQRLSERRVAEEEQARQHEAMARDREEREQAARVVAEELAHKEAAKRLGRLQELVGEAEQAAAEPDLSVAHKRMALARREWSDLGGGPSLDEEVAARFVKAEAALAAREADVHQAEARTRREALNRLQQLAARVEGLVARPGYSLKAGERALRDLRAALADVPPLPSKRDFEEITQRLKLAQGTLGPAVQELREAEEWKRFANLGVQEQLCAKMEALQAVEDPEAVARQIRELQQQWRSATDVPRAQGEALWRRFKTAHDEAWARCEAYFAEQAQVRSENLAKKIALCEQAEALSVSSSWIQTAEAIKRLQADWKTIGPVTRGQEKAIWERFRLACDQFFTRRQTDLVERKKVWAENLTRKEALCVKAEALAESTDWDATAAEVKRLQAEWKTIGPVKKSRSEAIWQRFRTACDQFFSRHAQRFDVARAERVAAREAVCASLEALGAPEVPEAAPDLLATVRTLRSRWHQELMARGVDRDQAQAFDRRFAAAFERVVTRWPAVFGGTDLDPGANRRRMEELVQRVEDLATSLRPSGPLDSGGVAVGSRLAAMLKEALAANTIGGKVDEESRWRTAQDEVRQAQVAWTRIGPVDAETQHVLFGRFQRACRRIADLGAARQAAVGAPRRPSPPQGRQAGPR